MVNTTLTPQNQRVNSFSISQPVAAVSAEIKRQSSTKRVLQGIYCRVWGKEKRIVFEYRSGRWRDFESFSPWDIREALRETLERIEHAVPGSLEKAAKLDDENWLMNRRRTRRYISEDPDLLYIESPHLKDQAEPIAGYYVITNIPWRDVSGILRLVCKAAGIKCSSLAEIRI